MELYLAAFSVVAMIWELVHPFETPVPWLTDDCANFGADEDPRSVDMKFSPGAIIGSMSRHGVLAWNRLSAIGFVDTCVCPLLIRASSGILHEWPLAHRSLLKHDLGTICATFETYFPGSWNPSEHFAH